MKRAILFCIAFGVVFMLSVNLADAQQAEETNNPPASEESDGGGSGSPEGNSKEPSKEEIEKVIMEQSPADKDVADSKSINSSMPDSIKEGTDSNDSSTKIISIASVLMNVIMLFVVMAFLKSNKKNKI